MDVDLSEITIIRIRLDNAELQDLVKGERIFADLDRALQLEIYHSPTANYGKPYINGEHQDDK